MYNFHNLKLEQQQQIFARICFGSPQTTKQRTFPYERAQYCAITPYRRKPDEYKQHILHSDEAKRRWRLQSELTQMQNKEWARSVKKLGKRHNRTFFVCFFQEK